MATLQALVGAIAEVEGINFERVRDIARKLRENHLIATDGRGTSAAKMSARDAANLLIGVNIADTARTAPDLVRRYRRLRAGSGTSGAFFGRELAKLISAVGAGTVAVFADTLEYVAVRPARSDQRGAIDYRITVRFEKPVPVVRLFVRWAGGQGADRTDFFERSENSPVGISDRLVEVTITGRTLSAVGRLLRK